MQVTRTKIEGLIEVGSRSCTFDALCSLGWNEKAGHAEFIEFDRLDFSIRRYDDDGNFVGVQAELTQNDEAYWQERIERDVKRQLAKWSYHEIDGWVTVGPISCEEDK